eukprot:3291654-Alexandrium_andersonii.AAC.1
MSASLVGSEMCIRDRRWALDLDELGDRFVRIWLKGSENALGDGPSRNPADRDLVKNLPAPSGP